MIDFLLGEPLFAGLEIAEPRRDRPSGRFAGEGHARCAVFDKQPNRGEDPALGAQHLDETARHSMGVAIDDHPLFPLVDPAAQPDRCWMPPPNSLPGIWIGYRRGAAGRVN
jgi:hypothetical protein